MIKWKVEKRKISELRPYDKNPRVFTEKGMKDLHKSIDGIGFAQPLNINQDGVVLSGNARLKALQEKGITEVDVYVAHRELTDKEEEEIIIRMNANEAGEWDFEILGNEFEVEDLTDWGFDEEELGFNTEEENEIIEDEAPEPKEDPISKLGDLWILGNHRLLCGDSTCKDTVDRLMNGKKADMVFTDPPYGMKKEKDGVLNDNLNYNDLLEFNKKWIPRTFNSLTDIGSWYCWGIDEPLMDIYSVILKPMITNQKATFRNLITWNKGNGQGQNSDNARSYAIADEKCLFVMCGVQGFNNNSDNYFDGWEEIRQYLAGEMKKVGGQKKWREALGNQMGKHYFTKSQWCFPTEENYKKLQDYAKQSNAGAFKKEYDELKKEYDELKKEYDELKKEYYATRAYFNNTHDNFNNVWHFDRTVNAERAGTGGHATPKPIALCERAIRSSSKENELVLDLFGGSGSTLIACEQTDRCCFMQELDPQYVDVIINRWQNLTGKQAVREDGKTYNELMEVNNG